MRTKIFATLASGLTLTALAAAVLATPWSFAHAADARMDQDREVYTARLNGAAEVPGMISDTTGRFILHVNGDESALHYRLSLKNGNQITDAQLYCGAAGQTGPAVVDLLTPAKASDFRGSDVVGSIQAEDVIEHLHDCDPGIRTVAHLVQAMREGKIYVNVSSLDHPDGEIRGQLSLRTHDLVMPVDDSDTTGSTTDTGTPTNSDNSESAGPNGAHILLSHYYVLPPDSFTVSGHRFAANELVRVNIHGQIMTVQADADGSFTLSPTAVPLRDAGTMYTVEATGLTSGVTETADLKVGTYYPVVIPSSWYMHGGDAITFAGRHFGPQEDVQVMLDNTVLGTISSDALGALNQSWDAPSVSGSHVFTFKGLDSGVTYRVGVNVAEE